MGWMRDFGRQENAATRTSGGGFAPTTLGDPDFGYANTPDSQAQFPSAAGEKRLAQNQTRATNVLTSSAQMGIDINSQEFSAIREQARKGFTERALTFGERMIGFIDGPRQFVNLAIQQIADPAENSAGFLDYMDALWGGIEETEEFQERTGLNPASGSLTLELFGWEEEERLMGKIGRGIADFTLQMVTDPLNYLTFGLSGLGKKAAMEVAESISERTTKEVLQAVATNTVDELPEGYVRNLAKSLPDLRQNFYGRVVDTAADGTPIYNKGSLADLYQSEPDAFEAMQRYMGKVYGLGDDGLPVGYDQLNKAVLEHIDELALRNQLANDILKPLLKRDFANIADGAEALLPLWGRGGARISFPFTRGGLEKGVLIPGSVGSGRRLVGDRVRGVSSTLKAQSRAYQRAAELLSSGLDSFDVDRALLRSLAAPVEKGGLAGWQYNIARNGLDRITNRVHKEQFKVRLNNMASELIEEAKQLAPIGGDSAFKSDADLSGALMRVLMDKVEGVQSDFSGADAVLDALGGPKTMPDATALATNLNKKMNALADELRDVQTQYKEVLARVAPGMADQLVDKIPHTLTPEGRAIVGQLAQAGAAVSKNQIAALETSGNPAGLFIAQLIDSVGRGGVSETQLGARFGGMEGRVGRNTIAALTDDGVIMVGRGQLEELWAKAEPILEGGSRTFDATGSPAREFGQDVTPRPDTVTKMQVNNRQSIMPVNELNKLTDDVIKLLSEEFGIKLPKGWDGRLFNDNALEVSVDYIDNLNDSVELWQSLEQLKIAGLAIPKKYVYDVNEMVQQMMHNVTDAIEDSRMPKPPRQVARNDGRQMFHSASSRGGFADGVPDQMGGADSGFLGPGLYASNNLQWTKEFAPGESWSLKFMPDRELNVLNMTGGRRVADLDEAGRENLLNAMQDVLDEFNLTPSEVWRVSDITDLLDSEEEIAQLYQSLMWRSMSNSRGQEDMRRFQVIWGKYFDGAEGSLESPNQLHMAGPNDVEVVYFNPQDFAMHSLNEPMLAEVSADAAVPMTGEQLRHLVPDAEWNDLVESGQVDDALDAFPEASEIVADFGSGEVLKDAESIAAYARMMRGEIDMVNVAQSTADVTWRDIRRFLLDRNAGDIYDGVAGAGGRYLKGFADWNFNRQLQTVASTRAITERGLGRSLEGAKELQELSTLPTTEVLARFPDADPSKAGYTLNSLQDAVDMGRITPNDMKGPASYAGKWARIGGKDSKGAFGLYDEDSRLIAYLNTGYADEGGFKDAELFDIVFQGGSIAETKQMRRIVLGKMIRELESNKSPGEIMKFMNDLALHGKLNNHSASLFRDMLRRQFDKLPDEVLDSINLGMPAEAFRAQTLFNEFTDQLNELLNGHGWFLDRESGQMLRTETNPNIRFQAQEGDAYMSLLEHARLNAEALGIPGAERIFKNVTRHKMAVASDPYFVNPSLFGLGGPGAAEVVFQKDVAAWLQQTAKNYASIYTPEGVAALKANANNILRAWRGLATIARPSFHIRNMIGATWNNQIIGVRTQDYMMVRDNALKLRNAMRRDNLPFDEALEKLTPEAREMFKAAWDRDVLSGFVTSEFRKFNAGSKAGRLDWLKPWDADNFALTRGGSFFMESIEDFHRMAAFARWFDPNDVEGTADLAAQMVKVVHFDYQNLTPIESRMKAYIPFFVWTRRNLPLQMSVFLENPKIVQRYTHMMQALDDNLNSNETPQDEMPVGDFYSAFAAGTSYYVNKDTPFWARVVIDPDLPVTDLARLPGLSLPEIAEFAMNMAGPHISMPNDLLSQRDFADVNAPAPFGTVLKGLSYVGMFDRTASGDVRIPYWMRTVMETALPFNREVTEPMFGGTTDPARQQRLGIGQDAGYLESAAKGVGNAMARGLGVKLSGPSDVRSVAGRSDEELDRVIQGLRFDQTLPPSER